MRALLIRCPDRIRAKGQTRRQFYHMTDITPTLLDLLGVPQATHVNGAEDLAEIDDLADR